ncbi:MAG: holin family protein [Lactobacillus sp.]|jgi:hypothetical protein|nr:holin family protein [Lactobacillus sp.]
MFITKLLGKIGLPVLIKLVKDSLMSIGSEAASNAVNSLGQVDTAIRSKEISVEQIKEANRHIEKITELETDSDLKVLTAINDTIQKELISGDKFVRFWRPFFGYSVSVAWLFTMLTICYCIIADGEHAPQIIMALVETTSLWGVALGVLGISVVKRSQEKASQEKQGVISNVINKIM